MRKPFVCGNWKLHHTRAQAVALAATICDAMGDLAIDVALAPSFTTLEAVARTVQNSSIALAAQDCFWRDEGAFTGEVSPLQLIDVGCRLVIVGHSERRQYFAELDSQVAQKVVALLQHQLDPIVCVGESETEREQGQTFAQVGRQLQADLESVPIALAPRVTIAYEPLWAIGTGKVATPAQAQQVHAFIRQTLAKLWSKEVASQVRIQYGGSVKPDNIAALMAEPDIDGALVGGASLSSADFVRICHVMQGAGPW